MAMSNELSFIHPRHISIFSFIRLSVPNSICSHYYHMERSLRMRRVTRPITGRQNDPHFCNPWTQFTYSLCHFRGTTTKIKTCYRRKMAFFPLWRLQSLLRMRSITWPVHRGSPKPHITIFYLYTIQLLWGWLKIPDMKLQDMKIQDMNLQYMTNIVW